MKSVLPNRPDPPKAVGIFFFCLFWLGAISLSAGQDRGIVLTPNVKDSIRSKPGSVVTATVTVTNRTDRKQTYDGRLVLPQGWRQVMQETSFELRPNERDVRLLSVAIPSETPAGNYTIRYHVADRATPKNEAEVAVSVVVLAVSDFELRLVDAPRFVLAGQQYHAAFILTNKGNAAGEVQLTVRSVLDFPVRLDSSRVILAPRESRSIAVTVTTNAALSTKALHNMELHAQLVRDPLVSVKAASSVEVIPHVTQTEERYHELPVYISLRAIGAESNNRFQLQAGGTGSFSETGEDRIDFLFRGPETQQISVFGQQDQYRVSYKRRGLELYLGDGNYFLSPLTELGRYSSGAGGKVAVGDFTLGGYYNETRWYSPRQKQVAGSLGYSLGEDSEIGVHYLKKIEPDTNGFGGEIATLRGLFESWQPARLDVEYALGSGKGRRGDAYSVRVNGNQQWIFYDLRYVHADPQYPGYYRDINFASASVNLSLWGDVRLEAYLRNEERNLRLDSTLTYAPRDQFVQIGTGYSSLISFYYRRNEQENRLAISKYHRVEDVAQMRFGYSFSGVDLFANADFGTTFDKLQNKRSPSKRYALFSTIRPTVGQSYNTSLDYTEDQNLLTGERQERYSASLMAWLSLSQATQIQFGGYASRATGVSEQHYNSLEFTFEHKFPFNHKIIIRGRQTMITPSVNFRERAYAIEYLVPIGIPIKRLTTSGSLRGRIVDGTGRGLENVLVNAGAEAAVSDRDGYFVFASLKPDKQYLIIDKATIGLDRVTMQAMPMEVLVRGGEEERVEIQVVSSAAVNGSVMLFDFAEENPIDTTGQKPAAQRIVEAGGQAGIVVELANGGESHRRISDNLGKFAFADLRPGTWSLKVVGGTLPPYHYVERESYEVRLEPGGVSAPVIRILPRRRAIQILQQGVLIQQGKPAAIITPKSPPPTVQKEEPCLIVYRKDKSGYVLQVSSWESEAKAKLQATVAEKFTGVTAFVERASVPGRGVRYRVSVGPFKSRAEAESMCTKVQVGE